MRRPSPPPCSRDRLTHNDIVATTYLSMSKISAPGGQIEGKFPLCSALWSLTLSLVPLLLVYNFSVEILWKREDYNVFTVHFLWRRALANETDRLANIRIIPTLDGGIHH